MEKLDRTGVRSHRRSSYPESGGKLLGERDRWLAADAETSLVQQGTWLQGHIVKPYRHGADRWMDLRVTLVKQYYARHA